MMNENENQFKYCGLIVGETGILGTNNITKILLFYLKSIVKLTFPCFLRANQYDFSLPLTRKLPVARSYDAITLIFIITSSRSIMA